MSNNFFQIISDATALAFKPDGQQVAVATMNGQITFFNPTTGQQMGGIEGRGDLAVGRQDTDLIKPQKAQARLYRGGVRVGSMGSIEPIDF